MIKSGVGRGVQNAKAYTEIQCFNETFHDNVTEATRKLRKANEGLKSLDQALDSTNRMFGLINDLLHVSRMDAGKFFIDATDDGLDLEVRGEVNQLANLAQSKSVTITYHPPKKKTPLIKLDLDKTRQVIMNIADNTVHYSAPPSGGDVVASS